jgi:hypothetical protein
MGFPLLSSPSLQVRSIYHRTAFQRDDSNAVRISLDTSLRLLKEEPLGDAAARGERVVCAPDEALDEPGRVYDFPFAVRSAPASPPCAIAST